MVTAKERAKFKLGPPCLLHQVAPLFAVPYLGDKVTSRAGVEKGEPHGEGAESNYAGAVQAGGSGGVGGHVAQNHVEQLVAGRLNHLLLGLGQCEVALPEQDGPVERVGTFNTLFS